jgi:opacity protein-like surface antigen
VKRHILLFLFLGALSAVAFSQAVVPASSPVSAHMPSLPAAEVYGGFQWESFDFSNFLGLPSTAAPRQNFFGFHTSSNFTFYRWLGAEGDFSRDSKTYKNFAVAGDKLGLSGLTVMGGPRISYNIGHLSQYAHVLLGLYRLNTTYTDPTGGTGSSAANAFSFAIGGGTTFRLSQRFGVATAADFIRPSKSGVPLNNIRVSFGPVFYFGGSRPEVARYTPAPVSPPPRPVRMKAPPVERRCIQILIDAKGNETCMRYADQK